MTNDTQTTGSFISTYSSKFSSATHELEQSDQHSENTGTSSAAAAVALNSEEEVFLMNIDYFEQWDRIYQTFKAQEKEVLLSMKIHGIKMI